MSRRLAVVLAVPVLALTGAGAGYGAAANPVTDALAPAIPQVERLAPDVAGLAGLAALPTAEPPAHASLGEEVLKFAGALGVGFDQADVTSRLSAARLARRPRPCSPGWSPSSGCAPPRPGGAAETPHAELITGRTTMRRNGPTLSGPARSPCAHSPSQPGWPFGAPTRPTRTGDLAGARVLPRRHRRRLSRGLRALDRPGRRRLVPEQPGLEHDRHQALADQPGCALQRARPRLPDDLPRLGQRPHPATPGPNGERVAPSTARSACRSPVCCWTWRATTPMARWTRRSSPTPNAGTTPACGGSPRSAAGVEGVSILSTTPGTTPTSAAPARWVPGMSVESGAGRRRRQRHY